MRLLLLGCTGFVGRELVPALLEANHLLTLVSRRLARGYEAERADGRLTWLQLDPAKSVSWQTPELVEALSTSDAVVNWPVSPSPKNAGPLPIARCWKTVAWRQPAFWSMRWLL